MTSTEVALQKWQHPYITNNFAQDMSRFMDACKSELLHGVEAQFYFSHFIKTGEWEQAQIWYSLDTDEEFENEADIPAGMTVSVRPRWEYQKHFETWCDENVPGFRHSTFMKRHRLIDFWCETGMDFPEAVLYITGLKMQLPTDKLLGAIEFAEDHTPIGVNWEVAARIPTLEQSPEELKQLPEKTQLEKVKAAAVEYAQEIAVPVSEGTSDVRKVAKDLDRILYKKPRISVIRPTDTDDYPYAIRAEYWSDEDVGYGEGDTETIYIRFVSVAGVILDDLPSQVQKWWWRKFGLRG